MENCVPSFCCAGVVICFRSGATLRPASHHTAPTFLRGHFADCPVIPKLPDKRHWTLDQIIHAVRVISPHPQLHWDTAKIMYIYVTVYSWRSNWSKWQCFVSLRNVEFYLAHHSIFQHHKFKFTLPRTSRAISYHGLLRQLRWSIATPWIINVNVIHCTDFNSLVFFICRLHVCNFIETCYCNPFHGKCISIYSIENSNDYAHCSINFVLFCFL